MSAFPWYIGNKLKPWKEWAAVSDTCSLQGYCVAALAGAGRVETDPHPSAGWKFSRGGTKSRYLMLWVGGVLAVWKPYRAHSEPTPICDPNSTHPNTHMHTQTHTQSLFSFLLPLLNYDFLKSGAVAP